VWVTFTVIFTGLTPEDVEVTGGLANGALALALREGVAAVAGNVPLTSVLLRSVALWRAPSASPLPRSARGLQALLSNTTGLAASFHVFVGSNETTGIDAAIANGNALGAWLSFGFSAKTAAPLAVTAMLAGLAAAAGVSDASSIAANGLLGAWSTFLVALPSSSPAPHLNLVADGGPDGFNVVRVGIILACVFSLAVIVRFRASLKDYAAKGLAAALEKLAAAATGWAAMLSGPPPGPGSDQFPPSDNAETGKDASLSLNPQPPPKLSLVDVVDAATIKAVAEDDGARGARIKQPSNAAEEVYDSSGGSASTSAANVSAAATSAGGSRRTSPTRADGLIEAWRTDVGRASPGRDAAAQSQSQSRASSPLRGSRPKSSPASSSSSPRRATLATWTPLVLSSLSGGDVGPAAAPAAPAAAAAPEPESAEAAAEAAAQREVERAKLLQWQLRVLGEQAQRLQDFEQLMNQMLSEQVAAAHVAGAASAAAAAGGGVTDAGASGGGGILSRSPTLARAKPPRRRRLPLPGSTWDAALAVFDADDPDAFAAEEEDEPVSPAESNTPRAGAFAKGAGAGAGGGSGALHDFSMMASASMFSTIEAAKAAGGAPSSPPLSPPLSQSRAGSRGPTPTISRRGSRRGSRRVSPVASRRGSRHGGVDAAVAGGTDFAPGVSGIPSSVLLSIRTSLAGPSYRLG